MGLLYFVRLVKTRIAAIIVLRSAIFKPSAEEVAMNEVPVVEVFFDYI